MPDSKPIERTNEPTNERRNERRNERANERTASPPPGTEPDAYIRFGSLLVRVSSVHGLVGDNIGERVIHFDYFAGKKGPLTALV